MSEREAADFVLVGASELVTCAGAAPACGPGEQSRVGVIERGALAARDGRIVWVGPEGELELRVQTTPGCERFDVGGRSVLPGLVDPHTHLVWGGDRADEFERRLGGVSYSEIAAAGGGILRTVEATRSATRRQLASVAAGRMQRLARAGATTIEVKSGYGLTTADELKILESARDASHGLPFQVVYTFLGAHTFPRDARGSAIARRGYVDEICEEMIPEVARRGLASFVDVFVDEHAFTIDEAEKVLSRGLQAGLRVKIHADQLADDGSALLAAELGAVSADHLEHASERGLRALADRQTVAVLIPGASLFLRMNAYANARRMIELGVPVALATDLNPGTCPCAYPPLVLQLGCLLCGLSIDEAIVAATLNAAAAAGVADAAGSLERGKRCDLLVLDASDRRRLIYDLGSAPIHAVFAEGSRVA